MLKSMFRIIIASTLIVCLVKGQQQRFQQQQQQQYQQQSQQQNLKQEYKPTTPPIPILAFENNVNYDGSFKYSYEGGDGTRHEQQGQLKTINNEAGEVSQGSYSYTAPDGSPIVVSYIADEHGFRAEGNHLPTPPPIPPEIQKSLAFLATAPPFKDDLAQ